MAKLTTLLLLTSLTPYLLSLVRKHIALDDQVESYQVPLDVKVEVLAGLLLTIIGTIAIYTTELVNTDGLAYFQCK